MLSNDRLRLGPKVTLKLITRPSTSTTDSSSALPGAPDVVPHHSPSVDTDTADLTSNLPTHLHSSHFEPVPIHAVSPQGTTEVSAPKNVNGPFRILRHLASGGFAEAVAVHDKASGRFLCLKVFSKDRIQEDAIEQGLLNELEVYKRLASSKECCPATMFLMELEMSFQTKKDVCFAMDLMTNDLTHYIDNEPEYCLENARRWSAQLALGINALHTMGIIHRDIKSDNILIDVQENVRIADFGLSYIDKDPKPLHAWRGYSSDFTGTIDCMAPEIWPNLTEPDSVKYGAPIDWWAFGRVLYELISPSNHKELFDSEADIMKYVAWHSKNSGKSRLFPSFQRLGPIAADLVAGLLNPVIISRYGFQQVTDHRYFSTGDGTSEFHGACSRAIQRKEQQEMLPSLWPEETQKVKVWHPVPPGHPKHVSTIHWKKPRP